MSSLRLCLWATLMAAAVSGCNDDGSSSGSPRQAPSPIGGEDSEITTTGVHAAGGPAVGEGQGGAGGEFRARAEQLVRLGSSADAPGAPGLPPPPASGTTLTDADLAQDVTIAGNVLIPGTVVVSGSGSVRRITAQGGSIVLSGTLKSGGRGLLLEAPSGTIHVTGTLSTAGGDSAVEGESGGSATLTAAQVAISGEILTSGENDLDGSGGSGGNVSIGTTSGPLDISGGAIHASGGAGVEGGGDGGDVSLNSANALRVHGEIYCRGGSGHGSGSGIRGGHGGNLSLFTDGALEMVAKLRIRGGAARSSSEGAQGGRSGNFVIDGRATARLYGTLDARGGSATAPSAGSGLAGGAAGSILLGQSEALLSLELGPGSVVLTGGSGGAAGGHGGPATLYSSAGNAVLAGTLDGSGGDSGHQPGNGSAILVHCDVGGGSILSSATLRSRGGSATAAGPGGAGGRIDLVTSGTTGAIRTDGSSFLDLDGGAAKGVAFGGAGGEARLIIPEDVVSVDGKVHARGGEAPGGTGGRGGLFWVVSDDNANSVGGDITLEAGSTFDLSGGAGDVGGHARHDDTLTASTDPELCSVILDSESGLTRNMGGIIRNNGSIVARGGASNGWGGDVTFHGRGHDTNRDPLEGNQDRAGHGSGRAGDYLSD